MSEKLLAKINDVSGGKPIRLVINTHYHPDHTGGNEMIAKSGGAIVAGNFAQQINNRTGGGGTAFIFAHENTLRHFELAPAGQTAPPVGAWPTDVFFGKRKDFSFNGEAVVLLFEPNAHTDGDILVHFRGSDVVAAGDVYINTSYPDDRTRERRHHQQLPGGAERPDRGHGAAGQAGGRHVRGAGARPAGRRSRRGRVPRHADHRAGPRGGVEEGRMTLQQVIAARPTLDYDGRYAAEKGPGSAASFIESVYAGVGGK